MEGRTPIAARAALAAAVFALAGCATTADQTAALTRPTPGAPGAAAGAFVLPPAAPELVQTGLASWYGPGFHGNLTANGEIFDQDALTAAHRTLPLPSRARITRLDTGASIMVRVNDRGPYIEGRVIDLSRAAADALGFVEDGLVEVRIEALGPADPRDRAAPPVFFDPAQGPPRGARTVQAGRENPAGNVGAMLQPQSDEG